MNKRRCAWSAVAAAAAIYASSVASVSGAQEDLRGADAVLQEFAKIDADEKPGPSKSATAAADVRLQLKQLAADIAKFPSTAKALPPEGAAAGWIALLERWIAAAALPPIARTPEATLPSFKTLLLSLPPPEAWASIDERLLHPADTAKRSPKLQLLLETLAALLRNDDAALVRSLQALRAPTTANGPSFEQVILTLESDLLSSTSDPAVQEDLFQAHLASETNRNELTVPDLVTVSGEETAAKLLRAALGKPLDLNLDRAGDRTTALARQLALEMIDDLKAPPWGLTLDLDSSALFEAIHKRFPIPGVNANSFQQASTYYVLGLIVHDRIDDAVAYAQAAKSDANRDYLSYQAVHALRAAGKTKEIYEFLNRLISADQTFADWSTYVSLAADLGKLDEVVTLAENAARHPGLPASVRRTIGACLSQAYLAADRVDEGIAELRKIVDLGAPDEGNARYGMTTPVDLCLRMARLGLVLHRPELTDEGLRRVQQLSAAPPKADGQETVADVSSYRSRELAGVLEQAGRPREAEEVLQALLLADGRHRIKQMREYEARYASIAANHGYLRYEMAREDGATDQDLAALAGLYGRQHRPADVVTLLDRATAWKESDLAQELGSARSAEAPLGFVAAQALVDVGRQDEAKRILTAMLDAGSEYDPAYELFLQLTPPEEAIKKFEQVFSRDVFQERPLIWKAEALGHEGRLDEAEAAARAAIAIDPSDGEEGRGLRMRAYTTLANILAAEGKEAEPYLSAVRAIRLSEDADEFYRAGLLLRAIPMYRQALHIFSDAYCIQSRLAIQLATLGQMDEAVQHYQRAFELMPTSFGRVESHCFGCEGVFNGAEAQGVAERVFTRLAAETPAKPQVFYLLGYLRSEERRYPEALEATRRAVALDPDYLNAWKRIVDDLAEHMHVARPEQDAAAMNILRLDPNGRHSSISSRLRQVRDFAGLWRTVTAAQPLLAPADLACYPLAATQARKAAASRKITPGARASDDEDAEGDYGMYEDKKRLPGAPQLLVRQEMMQALILSLNQTARER